MFLLLRQVSDYTEETIYLGIFQTETIANKAKVVYIEEVQFINDIFHCDQGYMTVNLEDDVQVISLTEIKNLLIDIPPSTDDGHILFGMFSIVEGFGQSVCSLASITSSVEQANRNWETNEDGSSSFPSYRTKQLFFLNVLRFRNDKEDEFDNFTIPTIDQRLKTLQEWVERLDTHMKRECRDMKEELMDGDNQTPSLSFPHLPIFDSPLFPGILNLYRALLWMKQESKQANYKKMLAQIYGSLW
jgi:hypothetical protein